jgi:hypothetical protein
VPASASGNHEGLVSEGLPGLLLHPFPEQEPVVSVAPELASVTMESTDSRLLKSPGTRGFTTACLLSDSAGSAPFCTRFLRLLTETAAGHNRRLLSEKTRS